MESRLRSAAHVAIVALALAIAPSSARADGNGDPHAAPIAEKAKKHLQLGLTHYQAKDYEAAIREFKTGYDIDPHPAFLFAWAQAERLSGDCRSAIFAYERYLDTKPDERQTAAAEDAIARCKVALGPDADKPQPAEDQSSVAPMPATTPASVVAAPRTVIIRDSTQPAWYKDAVGGALLGTGVAALAVGLGYYVGSSSDLTAADDAGTYGEYEVLVDRAEERRRTAWIGIGAGSALVSAAAFRYYTKRKAAKRKRRNVAVDVTDGGASFVFTTSF